MGLQDKIYQYFDRDPNLKVLFLFNNELLAMELRDLDWRKGFRYVEFQGDWFTTKYRLDHEWQDERIVIFFKQQSPLKDKSLQLKFPLMDVLCANMEYEEQTYAAFMQQNGIPDTDRALVRFIENNIDKLQYSKMMNMFQSYYQDRSVTKDLLVRGFICSFMNKRTVLGWDDIIVQLILLGADPDNKKLPDFFAKLRGSSDTEAALQEKLISIFGVGFDESSTHKIDDIVKAFKYNAIVQELAPVDADSYHSLRINDSIALQQLNRIFELAMSSKKTATPFLQVLKTLGEAIHDDKIFSWYGTDAKYTFLPEGMCAPIVRSLLEEKMETEPQQLMDRLSDFLIKYDDNGPMAQVMEYSIGVARFYLKLQSLGTLTLNTADEYVLRYEEDYYLLDQLYRQATESFFSIDPASDLFDAVQQVKTKLDANYSKFANRLNLEWTKCVMETGGMATVHLMRQNKFYEEKIKPMQKKVAVIVSDALRYEVGQEVVDALAKSIHVAQMKPALAMLPTETKYCKPSLLPHRELELYGVSESQDMSVDHSILNTTDKRSAQLQRYCENSICVPFETVAKYVQDTNREIFKNQVVYIFHDAIDKVGHDGTSQEIVAACRKAVDDIATMVTKILGSYGVTMVYVTSDHGFLFNDMVFAENDKHKVEEETLESTQRYYLTRSDAEVKGIAKFPIKEVSGISNADDVFVAVPLGTNRLRAKSGGYMFVHGGASLQEMIIPVITCRQQRADNKPEVGVMVLGSNLSMQASRLRFYLLQTEAVSMDTKESVINVAVYYNDEPVTPIKEIVLNNQDPLLDNRKELVDLTLNKKVEAKVLQLKVFRASDKQRLNPIINVNVTNNTLIESDFD